YFTTYRTAKNINLGIFSPLSAGHSLSSDRNRHTFEGSIVFYSSSSTTWTTRLLPSDRSIMSYGPSNMAGLSFFGRKYLPDHLSDNRFGRVRRGRRKRRIGTIEDVLESPSSALSTHGLTPGVSLVGSIDICLGVI
ncbi:hypothetical protein THAOC_32187, partial [Thalassiosira oceanica]